MLAGITRHNRIHLVGVGGSGMIGIARILLKQGFDVSGSDLNDSDELQILKSLGLRLQNNHSPNLITRNELKPQVPPTSRIRFSRGAGGSQGASIRE